MYNLICFVRIIFFSFLSFLLRHIFPRSFALTYLFVFCFVFVFFFLTLCVFRSSCLFICLSQSLYWALVLLPVSICLYFLFPFQKRTRSLAIFINSVGHCVHDIAYVAFEKRVTAASFDAKEDIVLGSAIVRLADFCRWSICPLVLKATLQKNVALPQRESSTKLRT